MSEVASYEERRSSGADECAVPSVSASDVNVDDDDASPVTVITSTTDAVCPGEAVVDETSGKTDNLSIKGRRLQGGTVSSHSIRQARGGQ